MIEGEGGRKKREARKSHWLHLARHSYVSGHTPRKRVILPYSTSLVGVISFLEDSIAAPFDRTCSSPF